MSTVVAIYTGAGLAEPLKAVFNELLPECRLVNIIDDGLIHDINRTGSISSAVTRRLTRYYENAVEMGADVILNTCSSVGEVADLGRKLVDVPIVKIDEAMVEEAVRRFDRIGVIATLQSTLEPTKRLILRKAEEVGKPVVIVDGLADGAYQALIRGQADVHDERIGNTALQLANEVDAIVLAQGSMARMQDALAQRTGLPVFSSLRAGVEAVRAVLNRQAGMP